MALLELHSQTIPPEWIDEFGHMNLARYVELCDQATYAFWNMVNAPLELEARDGREYAVLETHVQYLGELHEGEAARVTTQLLAHDAKRFILFHQVIKANGSVAASNEVKALGFNLQSRRAESFSEAVAAMLAVVAQTQEDLARPEAAGSAISLSRR